MKRFCVLAALLAFAAQAAQAAPVATDAEAMWRQFLATGDYRQSMDAYEVLTAIGYDGNQVDAVQCKRNADGLEAAIRTVPVSIALRRAAYLCADAGDDTAATDHALEVLAALSRHAMKYAGDPDVAKPIPIVAPTDAYALLLGSGLQETYEYYLFSRPARYFPLVMVGWDAESKTERHFSFDYVDTLHRLRADNRPHHGMPVVRDWIADAFVRESRMLASVDAAAIRTALATDGIPNRLAKLRGAALSGGVQSARTWLEVCAGEHPPKDCSAGLVDALMAQAEQKRGMPMVLLAFAYASGAGVKADPEAALALLDAAEQRWPSGALPLFAELWVGARGDARPPAVLRRRLESPQPAAAAAMRRARLQREIDTAKPHFSDADIAFLAGAAENGRGIGYGLLVDYFTKLDDQDAVWKWTAKSAEAGNPTVQSWLASALIFGDEKRVPKDVAKGRHFAEASAQGGDGWSARWLSNQEMLAGAYPAAEGWLLGSADAGDIDSIMQLAGIYAEERPEVSGDAKRAVEVYQMVADLDENGAPARRALAEMALAGIGMDKDPARALDWLKPDAEEGDVTSQVALAGHYLDGDFGTPNESEGTRWIQRAIKAGDEDAVTAYGSWLYYRKATPQSRMQAMDMLARADAQGNQGATNNYAWILCTSPLKEMYDPKRGLEASQRLGEVDDLGPGTLDTVAACHAANGDFARAVELQTRAARELAAYDTPRTVRERNGKEPGYVRRLGLYKAGKRYEEFDRNE